MQNPKPPWCLQLFKAWLWALVITAEEHDLSSVTRRLNHIASSVIFQLTDTANRHFDHIFGSMKGEQRTKKRINSLSVGLSLQNWTKRWDWSVLHLSQSLLLDKPSHRSFLGRRDGSLSHRVPLHHNQPLCLLKPGKLFAQPLFFQHRLQHKEPRTGGKCSEAAIPKLWIKVNHH